MAKHVHNRSTPLVLISPSTQQQGAEFADLSLSLSKRYTDAILAAGGLPFVMPPTLSESAIRELVNRCDGVMLTGGDDIQPALYVDNLAPELGKTVAETDPERDTWELELISEVFQQRKPFLGICRGHQLLNIALGGTLIVDIPSQMPQALNHKQFDRKADPVHELALTPGSMLEQITGEQKLGVNSTHHQAIGKVAVPLRASAHSSDGLVEAVELKDAQQLPFLLAMQFHPERMFDRYKVFWKVFSSFVAACSSRQRKNI